MNKNVLIQTTKNKSRGQKAFDHIIKEIKIVQKPQNNIENSNSAYFD